MKLKVYFKETHTYLSKTAEKIILSDELSTGFDNTVFVIVKDEISGNEIFSLQIVCEYYCSMFRNAIVWKDFIVIGFDNYGYLFNMTSKKVTSHKLHSYFDNISVSQHHVLISSFSHINCFDSFGDFTCRSPKFGIDGVKISKIENGIAYGAGYWGDIVGWKKFQFQFSKISATGIKRTISKRTSLKGIFYSLKRKAISLA